jgi:MinD superfamily P-loop ATPase
MRILFFSLKGGTGKSTMALNTALTTGCGLITNDRYSPVEKVLPADRAYKLEPNQELPVIPKGVDLVYDFGGYVDGRVVKAMEDADAVIVPTPNAYAEIQVALETIKETREHNKRIIVVVNKAGRGDQEIVEGIIRSKFKEPYPVLPLKATKALARIYTLKKPLSAWAAGRFGDYIYGEASRQFDAILAAVSKRK